MGLCRWQQSFDHVGPLARTVFGHLPLFSTTSPVYDSRDGGSARRSVPNYPALLKKRLARFRLGVPKQFYFDALDEEVRTAPRYRDTMPSKVGRFAAKKFPFRMWPSRQSRVRRRAFAEATSYHQLAGVFPGESQ